MKKLTKQELKAMLKDHADWLNTRYSDETKGSRLNLSDYDLRENGDDLSSANLSYANLRSANLRYANLRYADLSSANLRYANLRYADLSSANLSYADLSSADLRYANLSSADLRSADLSSANLRYADLSSADPSYANLSYANLRSANLRSANLSSANLSSANLRYANLSYADLSYANLRSANLSYADLKEIKKDFFRRLSAAKAESDGLYDYLQKGKVDGRSYTGECSCFYGTIATIRNEDHGALGIDLSPDANSLTERWFLGIQEGDIPRSNMVSKITCEWIEEFCKKEEIKLPTYGIYSSDEIKNTPSSSK